MKPTDEQLKAMLHDADALCPAKTEPITGGQKFGAIFGFCAIVVFVAFEFFGDEIWRWLG